MTGRGIAAMLFFVAGKHSIPVVDPFVSRSNPSPVAAGDGFFREMGEMVLLGWAGRPPDGWRGPILGVCG